MAKLFKRGGEIRLKVDVPKDFNPAARNLIAKDIIDFIRQRSQSGIGMNAQGNRTKSFVKYEDSYAKKKGQTNVDLRLSGAMLESMKVVTHRLGSVTIGIPSAQSGKAEGNITGSYGQSPNPAKARNFMGILKGDVARLARDFE